MCSWLNWFITKQTTTKKTCCGGWLCWKWLWSCSFSFCVCFTLSLVCLAFYFVVWFVFWSAYLSVTHTHTQSHTHTHSNTHLHTQTYTLYHPPHTLPFFVFHTHSHLSDIVHSNPLYLPFQPCTSATSLCLCVSLSHTHTHTPHTVYNPHAVYITDKDLIKQQSVLTIILQTFSQKSMSI